MRAALLLSPRLATLRALRPASSLRHALLRMPPPPPLPRTCAASTRAAAGDAPPAGASADAPGAPSSASSSSSTSPPPPPPLPPPSLLYQLRESVKDVLAVTLGLERVRDVGREYDAGLRRYPWVEYEDATPAAAPGEGEEAPPPAPPALVYRNEETGATTSVKPADFDARAPAAARRVRTNAGASALAAVRERGSAWSRTLAALQETPIINALLGVGAAVAASPVGAAAAAARARVRDKLEDAREVWETSQHPLVVSASHAVDAVTAETESGRAIRELTAQDEAFDAYAFIDEMTRTVIPAVVPAFFRMDMPALRFWCKDGALAQVRAVAAAREIEGLSMDGVVLNVTRVEIGEAKTLERGVPIILVTSQVQYIHCVRNRKREIVEGSEGEIRAAFFVFAVTRELDPATGALAWRIVEMSMQGSMLYL